LATKEPRSSEYGYPFGCHPFSLLQTEAYPKRSWPVLAECIGPNLCTHWKNAALPRRTPEADIGQPPVFDAVTGNLLHTYLNPTPAVCDNFGGSVAISGDGLVRLTPISLNL